METNLQISSASVTDRGLSEKRPQNEDSYLEIPNIGLYAVADGVGGAQAGEVASQMAMEILGEAFLNRAPGSDAEVVMRLAIERANGAIFQMSGDLAQLSMMATTIVAIHIVDGVATIGHVGDSRVYRLDSLGNLYRETQDHSVVEEEVRAGRMTAAQAANHPSRNVISRALGAEASVEVDLKTIMFEPGTIFLLCSDGITRHITDFELRELLLSSPNPSVICDRLKAICFDRGAEDNLTAVVVRASESVAPGEPEVRPTPTFADIEEETVMTPRPSMDAAEPNAALTPAETLEMPVADGLADSDEQYLIHEEPDGSVAAPVYDPNRDDSSAAFEPIRVNTDDTVPFSAYEEETVPSGGRLFGRLAGPLVWLIVGAAVGAGGLIAYQNYFAPLPEVPVLKEKTNNIPQASVETLRQDAITKPAEVIRQYESAPPKDASDFYILGKAHLYSKNYDEAKRRFLDARNLLKDVTNAENKTALAAEITQALVIAQSKEIQAAFEKELKFSEPVTSNLNANSSREP